MDSSMERRLTELILIARLNKQFFYKAHGSKPSLVFSSEEEGWETLLDDREYLRQVLDRNHPSYYGVEGM